jgi:transcriptional regulator GlxA family with amidase domain
MLCRMTTTGSRAVCSESTPIGSSVRDSRCSRPRLRRIVPAAFAFLACAALSGCGLVPAPESGRVDGSPDPRLQVGFLVLDRVYGSELVAPHDVFQHTVFHTEPGMRVFTVGRTRAPITTFEGLVLTPDYALEDAPEIDVLVVPSAEHNLDTDLEDRELIAWVQRVGSKADWIVSLCDGAFVLAEAGLLDDRVCTTFPGDIEAFRERYPHLDVREGVSFVADGGKVGAGIGGAVTSAGGAKSYDPAFWLVEHFYGRDVARGIGGGLVVDWRLDAVEHVRVERETSGVQGFRGTEARRLRPRPHFSPRNG